jgi:hypothetical protein
MRALAAAGRRADGFRERGHQVTRLEAFVDAAFAFAVTLLVISFDRIPASSSELLEALKGIPAFAASFALIAMFWYAHNTWSRRYGLDDGRTAVLSLALVFQVLVYVYPLRILFGSCFAWLSAGWIPHEYRIAGPDDLRTMYLVYAAAWSLLGLNLWALYRHAWAQRLRLGLDREELVATAGELAAWWAVPATGLFSAGLALVLLEPDQPNWVYGAPGMAYALMSLNGPLERWARGRKERDLGPERQPGV